MRTEKITVTQEDLDHSRESSNGYPYIDITTGFLIIGTFATFFPAIIWRGKCYALFLRWGWPLVRIQHFGIELPLQECE